MITKCACDLSMGSRRGKEDMELSVCHGSMVGMVCLGPCGRTKEPMMGMACLGP